MIKRIVMMEGGVETLSYFSHQMAQEFQMLGYAVFFYDLKQEESSAGKLRKFIRPRETVLVTFNFQGLEKEAGVYREGIGYLWDTYQMCIRDRYTMEDIEAVDMEIAQAIKDEFDRQNSHIELIASENWVSPAVMSAMGSVLTNKYAEGYPGKRYYGGCDCVDVVEELARERAKKLFEMCIRARFCMTRWRRIRRVPPKISSSSGMRCLISRSVVRRMYI